MNKINKLKKDLQKVDNNIDNFVQTETSDMFYIIDIQGMSKIYQSCNEMGKCFSVYNEQSLEIFFIPIDGKNGLLNFGTSYCDTVIFSKKDFCFLEFKLNATSQEVRAIRKNRKKAIKQLSNTIDYFDEKLDKNYLGLNLEAYVSTPNTYPRQDTSWMNFEVEFLEKFGIPLFEKNEKRF